MSITIHQVRATVRSPPASAMSLKPNDALWAVGVGVGHGPCFNGQWLIQVTSSSRTSLKWQFLEELEIHPCFFFCPDIKMGAFLKVSAMLSEREREGAKHLSSTFFMVFRASSTEINTQKKTPASRYIWIKKCILNIYLPIVFFSEWLTHLDVFGWRLLYIPPWWLNCYVSSACFPEIQTELKRRRRESKVPSPRVQIAAKLLWNLGWNHEPG